MAASRWVLVSLLVGVAGLGGAASAPAQGVQPHPIVYGYPYTSRCPAAGVAEVIDRYRMYACNCTSYVAWALARNGQRTDWFIAGSMNAWNWPNVARAAGLVVNSTPTRGAVAVWPHIAPPFGHVAYVTDVHPDGRVDVAEYNFPVIGRDAFIFGTRNDVRARGAVFIHVPRERDEPSR
jgi:surface antigen